MTTNNGSFMPPTTVHRNDPVTSHEAAEVAKKQRQAQRLVVFAVVRDHPGLSGREIAELIEGFGWALDPHEKLYQVRRRLSDLSHGIPRLIEIVGKSDGAYGRRESLWALKK